MRQNSRAQFSTSPYLWTSDGEKLYDVAMKIEKGYDSSSTVDNKKVLIDFVLRKSEHSAEAELGL